MAENDDKKGCGCEHPAPDADRGTRLPDPPKDAPPANDPGALDSGPNLRRTRDPAPARARAAPLRRYPRAGWLGGVCAGIAYQIDVPTWLVRFVWTLFFLTFGVGLLAYVLLWIFVPSMDTPLDHDTRF